MILFWLICAALLVVAVLFVALPLWRGRVSGNQVARNSANLQILRDQLRELESDLNNGLLTPELYAQGKRELESRVLEESATGGEEQASARPFHGLAMALSILLIVASGGVYLAVGTPNAMAPGNPHAGMGGGNTPAELEQKVKADPTDATSLVMLARSYMEAGRYTDSAQAYGELVKLVPNEAWLWADYADAEAMAQGKTLRGKPTQYINKALALDPNSMKSLALAGSAAMERGDFADAIKHWEKLRAQLPPDSEDARAIEGGLAEARQMLAHIKGGKIPPMLEQIAPPEKMAVAAGKERITGRVTLDPSLKDKYSPDDTLFVLARAAQGPKMPLAIMRLSVADLPLDFELDDSMAMAPQMKLSSFEEVVVVGRISKSGTAMPQAGDAEGFSITVKPGSKGVKVNINHVVE